MQRGKISRTEIKDAIYRSGYLIEQRVTRILSKDYFVRPNHLYLDPVSGKTREIDMRAGSTVPWSEDFSSGGVYWSIFCECENNMQPVVFFPFEPLMPSAASTLIKCYGMPMKIWQNDEYLDVLSFLPFYKFHHYCKGSVATQYCSFTKPGGKKEWIATHLEEQHDTFNSLLYATEDEINRFYSEGWTPPKEGEIEPILMVFIYPLVILGGELMQAYLGRRGLVARKIKHAQLLKSLHISGQEINYKIDVITEDYLSEYMAIIAYEMSKLKRLITRHKKIITASIEHIVSDVKYRKPGDSYKRLLTVE